MVLASREFRKKRQFFIEKVHAPTVELLKLLRGRIPVLEESDTSLPNAKTLIWVRDWFFPHLHNRSRQGILRTVFNYVIYKYVTDPFYRYFLDIVVLKIIEIGWQSPPPGRPSSFWWTKEPYEHAPDYDTK